MLWFCEKTVAKESHNFELARLKKKEKHLLASGSVLSLCFFTLLGVFLIMKTSKVECYVVIKAYCFRDVKNFFLSYIECPHIPTYRICQFKKFLIRLLS